jgi:pyruvate dehydrogenase E2 component (dihydrolipoamide acetyltransferase)
MLPLSLSYDHRVIDGAQAARFTRAMADHIENTDNLILG